MLQFVIKLFSSAATSVFICVFYPGATIDLSPPIRKQLSPGDRKPHAGFMEMRLSGELTDEGKLSRWQSKHVDIAGSTVDWQLDTSMLATCCPAIVRPAMLLRRKVCAAVVIAAILFLMLASHSIHRRHFLPLSLALSIVQATPTGRETGEALQGDMGK